MAKYIVQYEVVGFVDVEVDANSVHDAMQSPIFNKLSGIADEDITPGDNWVWTLKIVYTEEGERVWG